MMANRNRPHFMDYATAFQLLHLQDEAEHQTKLLRLLENRLANQADQLAKENEIANFLFVCEKIFEDLAQLEPSPETVKLILDFDTLYTEALKSSRRETSNIEVKRDLDKLLRNFSKLKEILSESRFQDIRRLHKLQTEKIADWGNLQDKGNAVMRRAYQRPWIIKVMNFLIWPISFFFAGGWNLIWGYYGFAILIRLVGPSIVRSNNQKRADEFWELAEQKLNEAKQLEKQMELKPIYLEKLSEYQDYFEMK
jgi:hypothetical protein